MILVNYDKVKIRKQSEPNNFQEIDAVAIDQEMIDKAEYTDIYTVFQYRNYIYLPAQLEANTTYEIIIYPGLAAANGQTIGQLYTTGIPITFTTGSGPQ